MYEQYRNDVLAKLTGADLTVEAVLQAMDHAAAGYDVRRKETGLTVPDEGLPEVAKIYLVCKKMAGLTDATLENYTVMLEVFFRELRKPLPQITPNDIRLWLFDYQRRRGVSARTLDKYREYISRFFSWAQDEGYLQANPCKKVEAIKFEENPREALTQVEMEYLRLACQTARETAMLEVLYSTGCRVSELAGLKQADVDWREKTVHLFGKGRKHRTSFLNARAEVALRVYLDSRTDDSPYLFVSIRKPCRPLSKDGIEKIFRVLAQRCGVHKKITPHVLRHTTATTALMNGMPIEDISKLLGHESIDTTRIYAESSIETVKAGHKRTIV